MGSWRPAAGLIDRTLDAIPPASGAVVMGTGIVSIGLSLDAHETISRVLLVLDACIWVALGVLLPARATRDRARFLGDVQTPAALTSVAGSAVLGTRLALLGWDWAGIALLVLALVLWAALLSPVLRNWRTPTVGSSLVLTVSTESLAVLAATLAVREHADWLLFAALAPFALGLCFYAFVIARFDPRQLGVGRGDHWITGGALAISTLAAGKITAGAKALGVLGNGGGAPKSLSLGLWVLTMLWLPVLLLAETLRPRLRYDVRRWSTVSPSGCMPLAASSSAPSRTRARSPASLACGCGSGSRCGESCSRRCSGAATNSLAKRRHGSTQSASTSTLPADPAPPEPVSTPHGHPASGVLAGRRKLTSDADGYA